MTSVLVFPSLSASRITQCTSHLGSLPTFDGLFLLSASILPLLPRFSHSICGSTGLSTCSPSPTLLSLGLGPDLPWVDYPSPGNLRFSTVKFLTSLSLLIPAFSLLLRPHLFSLVLLPTAVCSPTNVLRFLRTLQRFGVRFSPVYLRRRFTRPVRCYSLFKCMAASKPTSWLSLHSHILFHLTFTSGP